MSILRGFSAFVLAVIPFSSAKCPRWLSFAEPCKDWLHDNQVTVAVIAAAVIVLAYLFFAISRLSPSCRGRKLKDAVDSVAEHAFGLTKKNPELHNYRVTLFRPRWFPFVGSWLGMVARSGVMHLKRRCVFSINSEREEENTGVAGECWRQDGGIVFKELPDISDDSPQTIEEYKRRGFIADCEYKDLQRRGRVVLAIGIRRQGKRWGVLVLDTTDEMKKSHLGNWRQDAEYTASLFAVLLK